MEAKELRIGNLIDYCGDIVEITMLGQVGLTARKNGTIVNCTYNAVHLHPITVTEEILLKAGFEKKLDFSNHPSVGLNSCFCVFDGLVLNLYKNENEIEVEFRYPSFDIRSYMSTQLKGFHHLQNVVYDLTGKELEIKL